MQQLYNKQRTMFRTWNELCSLMLLLFSGRISAVRDEPEFYDHVGERHYSPYRSELVFHPEWRQQRQTRSLNVINTNVIHHEDTIPKEDTQHTDKEIISHHSEENSQLGTIAHKMKNVPQSEIELILKVHNKFRRHVKPNAASMRRMRWNDRLASVAATYVSKCIYAHSDSSNVENEEFGAKLGENIFVVEGKLDLTTAINQWYSEVNNYDWTTGNCEGVCGHYTQVVWDVSDEVGCSYAHCLGGTEVNEEIWQNVRLLVCNYFPAGNEKAGFWFNKKIRKPYTFGDPCTRCQSSSDTCYQGLCEDGPSQLIPTEGTRAVPLTTENDILSVFKSRRKKIEFGELSWGRGAVVSIRIPTPIPEERLTTTSYDVTEDDKLIIVLSHNRKRSEADPPASNLRKLVWSEHLASQATMYIKECSDFEGNRQGDNLHFSEDELGVEDIIQEWSEERYSYEWEENQCYDTCKHYRQLVWDVTHKVGCAKTRCYGNIKYDGVYWHDPYVFLCHYDPVGNTPGENTTRLFGQAIRRPYIAGEQCSKCDSNKEICINGLCEATTPVGRIQEQTTLSHDIQKTDNVTILPCLCENGGMCVPDFHQAPGLGAYECRCMQGYAGKFCNERDSECLPGFTGVNCEDIDECDSEPCFPGVACENVIGSFFCDLCPEGLVGNGLFCSEDYEDYIPEEEEGPATNVNEPSDYPQVPSMPEAPTETGTTVVSKTTDTPATARTENDRIIQENDLHTERIVIIPRIVEITSERAPVTTISLLQAHTTREVTTKSQTTMSTTKRRMEEFTTTVSSEKLTTANIQDTTTKQNYDTTAAKYTTGPTTTIKTTMPDATTTAVRSPLKTTSIRSSTTEAKELTTTDKASTTLEAKTTVPTTLEITTPIPTTTADELTTKHIRSPPKTTLVILTTTETKELTSLKAETTIPTTLETTTPLQTTTADKLTTKSDIATTTEKLTSTTPQTSPSSTVLLITSRSSTTAVKSTAPVLRRISTTPEYVQHTANTSPETATTLRRALSTTSELFSTTTTTTTTSQPSTTTEMPILSTTRSPPKPRKPTWVRRCKKTKKGKKICKLVQKIPGSRRRIKQRPNIATIGGKPIKYYVKQHDGKRVRYTYRGKDCLQRCGSRGKCTANGMCRCKPEYAGRFCERSACNDLCKNNGVCISRNKCECNDDYFGDLCEDFTCRQPCQNNGICVAPNRCECPKGFEGEMCELPLCEPECKNGGQCGENNVCSCENGYIGHRCQQAVCRPGCVNGGTCTNKDVCSCPPGFLGSRCQISVCIPTCGHGGRCLKNNACMCRKGWKGTHCRTPICIDKCAHGGTCIAPNKCQCKNGWSGSSCRTGHCERRCRYGARCVRPNLCKCPYGPRGKGCRLKLRFGRKPSSVLGSL